jgi:hypothetical protein
VKAASGKRFHNQCWARRAGISDLLEAASLLRAVHALRATHRPLDVQSCSLQLCLVTLS